MAYITEKISENSAKCKECPVNLMRLKIQEKGTFADVLTQIAAKKGAQNATDVMMQAGCTVCPYETDFKKVYGVSPYEYFTSGKKQ